MPGDSTATTTAVVDLHTHSRFFHRPPEQFTEYDHIGVRMAAAAAQARGVDRIAVTNHNYHRPAVRTSRTIPGIEVSTTDGHVLIIGPDPPEQTESGALTPTEAVALAHDRGCAAVIAHPFRRSSVADSGAAFDAVELNGKRPERRARVRSLAKKLDVPVVGGSDAHIPVAVGRAATRIRVEQPTPAAVVAAIQRGDVTPVVRSTPVDWMMQRCYRAYHGA